MQDERSWWLQVDGMPPAFSEAGGVGLALCNVPSHLASSQIATSASLVLAANAAAETDRALLQVPLASRVQSGARFFFLRLHKVAG